MKIKSLSIIVLLVLAVLPAAIAQEELESIEKATSICVDKIEGDGGCVILPEIMPPQCTATYDDETQQTITNCPPYARPRIDVVFVIDSTGSMADEIRTVKTHIKKIVREVENGQPSPYLRIGVVSYRDHPPEEEEYLVKSYPLTSNIEEALRNIENIEAHGGGDLPEAVADGLYEAIDKMNWEDYILEQNQETEKMPYYDDYKKLIFLIGDAAPHGEGSADRSFQQGCPNGLNYRDAIKDASAKGIRIYAVSGSGIDSVGIRVFREIAEKTGGGYTHLSYTRQEVEEYYEEEGFSLEEVKAYSTEARKDADYDKATNSILTNSLGSFAKASIQAEATKMGVSYDNDGSHDAVDSSDTIKDLVDKKQTGKNLYQFFRRVFDRIAFWER